MVGSPRACVVPWIHELLRCGKFVPPGIAKLVVQKRERRTGRNPATGAAVEIPARQVIRARIAKPIKDAVETRTPWRPAPSSRRGRPRR